MKRSNSWLFLLLVQLININYLSAQETILSRYTKFLKAVDKTSQLARDQKAIDLAKSVGLSIVNVTWEDTGRTKNSAWGDNISDLSIQVHTANPDDPQKVKPVLMPVVRYDNFNDKTADLKPSDFFLLVGNESGLELEKVSLTEYLGNFRKYLSDDTTWAGDQTSLLAPRDTSVLVSAQHTFLPIPKGEKASFNPVIFNYQSYEKQPAVLTIVATREGTSATIIDYSRDSFDGGGYFSSGQRLYFNDDGQKASFTGERLSNFILNENVESNPSVSANQIDGLNMVLLIQVPLQNVRKQRYFPLFMTFESMTKNAGPLDVEEAVIGHGEAEGLFGEVDGLEIKRDERYPVRVTVQFYHATNNAVVDKLLFTKMRKQIDSVYKNADYVGSLVTEGETSRPTEHSGPQCQYYPWWPIVLEQTGLTSSALEQKMQSSYGPYWNYYCTDQKFFQKTLDYLSAE